MFLLLEADFEHPQEVPGYDAAKNSLRPHRYANKGLAQGMAWKMRSYEMSRHMGLGQHTTCLIPAGAGG